MKTKGLLLINLGTPDNPQVPAVRQFLRQFLADPRVIDLPAPLRYLLLYAFILPFRPIKSAHAYQSIWTDEGSPLLQNGLKLINKIKSKLSKEYSVALGMRYGNPSISEALDTLSACNHLTIVPLFPQYSSAANGSSIEQVLQLIAKRKNHPSLTVIRDFYNHPGFITAQAAMIRPYLNTHDFLLLSYHGIPEKHLQSSGCLNICKMPCPEINQEQNLNSNCYRAQCYATSRALAQSLNLNDSQYGVSFQSRLGKTPWVSPYTDQALEKLATQGVKRLAIACPSFVADCLETLEEIGITAKQQWLRLGGEQLSLIPCLNADDRWVTGLLAISQLEN